MRPDAVRHWQHLTTAEARDAAARDPVVILPLAAIEQHGPHLPLSTDLDIGMGLLASAVRQLPEGVPAWILPPQAVGSSREHLRFAGTLSLDVPLLIEVIYAHGLALASCGVRRLVLSNSHGGNRQALDVAGLRLRQDRQLLVVKTNYFDFARPDGVDLPEAEWRHGLHGGALETSMMLHLRPDLVRTAAIQDAPSLGQQLERTLRHLRPEGAAAFSWLADDLNPSGVTGDARLATAALGERLVTYYGGMLAGVIRDASAFPLERLAPARLEGPPVE
jgi:creatinine amidohydrolase